MNLFVAWKLDEDYQDILGIFDTHEKAKACLHRYMNQYDDLKKYVWEEENHRYISKTENFEDMSYSKIYCICKSKLNEDTHT